MSDGVELQSQLLLAAFAEPPRAMTAWTHWQAQSRWQRHVAFDAYLLLPRVYHNLGGRGVDDALFTRLKGVVKRNWLANAATMAAIGRVTQALQASDIAAVLLPPCALLLADRSVALEPGTPIACQLARSDAQRVTRLLRAQAWHCIAPGVPLWSLPGYIAASPRLHLRAADGMLLDLHWVDALGSLVSSSASRQWHGRTLLTLDSAASIRLLITSAGLGTDLARVARALLLLEPSPDNAGWCCLLQLLRQYVSPFYATVASLAPVAALSGVSTGAVKGVIIAAMKEVANAAAQPAREGTFSVRLHQRWRHYRRTLGDGFSTVQAILCLPGYLMGKWDLQQLQEILPRLSRAVRYQWRLRNRCEGIER